MYIAITQDLARGFGPWKEMFDGFDVAAMKADMDDTIEAILQKSIPEPPGWHGFLSTQFPTCDCRHGRCV